MRFNSLQTGKRIQSKIQPGSHWQRMLGFNSLQTGKRIQSIERVTGRRKVEYTVSIPFKRESVSKGKKRRARMKGIKVSIPFKRESVSKETPF